MDEKSSVLNKLIEARSITLQLLQPLSQDELDLRPPGSLVSGEWSLGEVFMHIALDEIYLRELIARPLLEGVKPPEGITFLPPPPPIGVNKDVILFWFERARSGTIFLFENWPEDANLKLTHKGGFDEGMNGLEWLAGYASHEAFHHRQIQDLIDQNY
ncbi:MAG: DinB family protein [Anaerolineales bacterium]|jgi:hypothetical protein